jgi:sugar/nucleoside kinase (ribokinase family)
MPNIFVIGTASLDTLHFAGQTVHVAGGAGLYTALAAYRAESRAGLFAPRPTPMPTPLAPVTNRVDWVGPEISPADLPRLEIAHHGGGRATLVDASWGAETRLTPQTMPPQVSRADIVHIAALSSARRQLDFLQALQAAPTRPLISAGTYARLVYGDTELVRQVLQAADLFFMNENEAVGLFGSVAAARVAPNKLLFVTLGERGALVIEGERGTMIPVCPAVELDPTGAGDTFCGAVLAGLGQNLSPVEAARGAVKLAAQTIAAPGPAASLDFRD